MRCSPLALESWGVRDHVRNVRAVMVGVRSMILGFATCAVVWVLIFPGVLADAATSEIVFVEIDAERGLVTVEARGDGANRTELSVGEDEEARFVRISDEEAEVLAGDGCIIQAFGAECRSAARDIFIRVDLGPGDDFLRAISPPSRTELEVNLGPGNDTASLGPGGEICGGFPCTVNGGRGDDRITGSETNSNYLNGGQGDDRLLAIGPADLNGGSGADASMGGPGRDVIGLRDGGNDILVGGGGDDHLHDRGGEDLLFGGKGDDAFYSSLLRSPVDDVLLGGSGTDFYVRYCGSCSISLNGRADDGATGTSERDQIEVETVDVENWTRPGRDRPAGTGADHLVGSDRRNQIFGTRGPDLIIGRGGQDKLFGSQGNDRIRSVDGERDRVVCGRGNDRARVDPLDRVTGCERIQIIRR